MGDLFQSGYYNFTAWAAQQPMPNGQISWNRWLGEFNPHMSADEANVRLDHVGKITEQGQAAFKRGWESARLEYLANTDRPLSHV